VWLLCWDARKRWSGHRFRIWNQPTQATSYNRKRNSADASILHNRLFGFLLGATAAGAGMYYYVLEEYRVSNELLTEDIYVRLLELLFLLGTGF
jgi:hypothetical protein